MLTLFISHSLQTFDAVRAAGAGTRLEEVVRCLAGDCCRDGLGLSTEDRRRLESEVHVFVHAAASVRFDDSLQKAVLQNTRAAREVSALAAGMHKLKVLVHVSTAYCNTHQPVIEERVYPMPPETRADWREILRLAETVSEKELAARVATGYHPNTYTFSKALAEQVMRDHSDRLNVAIFRPSMVIAAVKEPMPGWTTNFNGPLGLALGITKGLVHTVLADKDAALDMVPVEMVVNGIILAVREGILRPQSGLRVYNGCASQRKTLPVRELVACALRSCRRAPHDRVLWHPSVAMTGSVAWFTFLSCLLHFLPAIAVDAVCRVTGYPPRLFKTFKRVYRSNVLVGYFARQQWVFENDNFFGLSGTLSAEDAATFKLDYSDLNEEEYFRAHLQYLRRYVLKENMDKKAARRNQTM
ncbi:hypothetical protein ONE63_008197 [Megalurothrips usitatus]|uniref:Fatty acyl-CoA reductase n=1 Tax=Megalurothrips usitatus TaxID=439358 RepID=A0AAV7XLR9_9NEOP|nr:hypothetical protein ONE63_008197 [Megalurothrips usitatus]